MEMGKDVSLSGDTPDSGDTSLQTDQSVQSPEELFGVGDISKLPEALRPTYQNWQKEYTQKRQEEKAELDQLRVERDQLQQENALNAQKAEQYDELYNNPTFQNWALSEVDRMRGQQQPQQQGGLNYDAYEDGDALRSLVSDIKDAVLDGVRQEMQPIIGSVAANNRRAEMDALAVTAKQNNWPDPGNFVREMEFVSKKYPAMSLNEVYDMARGMRERSVVTRPPVNANVNNQAAPTQDVVTDSPLVKPGGTSVNSNPLAGMTAIEQALVKSNTKDTSGSSLRDKVVDKIPTIMKEIAQEMGVDITRS
jgi:hypothetical protein